MKQFTILFFNPVNTTNNSSSKTGTVAGLMEGFMKRQSGGSSDSSSPSAGAGGSKMVTIRRVMEPNNADPTVTISMKGETPDADKLIFTLVNGQVIPSPGVLEEEEATNGNNQCC
jgi:hypothetical protein